MTYIISQAFAFGSLFVTCLSTWGKKGNMVTMLVLDSIFLGCCYALLGEYSGAITSVVCLCRSVAALYFDRHPDHYRPYVPFLFGAVFLTIGFVTFDGLPSMIACAAGLISCFSVFSRNDSIVRISIAAVICLWLCYDISVHSYVSMIGESISAVSAIAAIYTNELRPYLKKRTIRLPINA